MLSPQDTQDCRDVVHRTAHQPPPWRDTQFEFHNKAMKLKCNLTEFSMVWPKLNVNITVWNIKYLLTDSCSTSQPEVSAKCTPQKTWDSNDHSLLGTFLADNFSGHCFASSNCTSTVADSWHKGMIKWRILLRSTQCTNTPIRQKMWLSKVQDVKLSHAIISLPYSMVPVSLNPYICTCLDHDLGTFPDQIQNAVNTQSPLNCPYDQENPSSTEKVPE